MNKAIGLATKFRMLTIHTETMDWGGVFLCFFVSYLPVVSDGKILVEAVLLLLLLLLLLDDVVFVV